MVTQTCPCKVQLLYMSYSSCSSASKAFLILDISSKTWAKSLLSPWALLPCLILNIFFWSRRSFTLFLYLNPTPSVIVYAHPDCLATTFYINLNIEVFRISMQTSAHPPIVWLCDRPLYYNWSCLPFVRTGQILAWLHLPSQSYTLAHCADSLGSINTTKQTFSVQQVGCH